MNSHIVTLDVREDLRNGRQPFSKIMGAAAQLRPDEKLLLVTPFEPVPLFGVLAKQGFSHTARRIENGDWEVLFSRTNESQFSEVRRPVDTLQSLNISVHSKKSEIIELDARGLEPPQPMIRILETLATLPPDAQLRARTDRRPMHLYAQLEVRGFSGETREENDGSFVTHIRPG